MIEQGHADFLRMMRRAVKYGGVLHVKQNGQHRAALIEDFLCGSSKRCIICAPDVHVKNEDGTWTEYMENGGRAFDFNWQKATFYMLDIDKFCIQTSEGPMYVVLEMAPELILPS